jgi:hypothetical protein
MTRSITTAAAIYGFAVPALHAQVAARPNFSGSWTMDAAKSTSTATLPTSVTWVMSQHGDTLIADRTAATEESGEVKSHLIVGFDGKGWKNTITQPGAGEIETTTVASWDKGVLVMVATGNIQGTDFILTDRLSLSADGKTITAVRSVTVEGNEVQSTTYVMVKKS